MNIQIVSSNIKKICLMLLPLLIASGTSFAQSKLSDANGHPLSLIIDTEIEGSPYLFDDWKNGSVKLTNGTIYKNTELKVNLIDNQLLFKGSNDKPLLFVEPIKEFTLFFENDKTHDKLYRNGYDYTNNFYEVLVDGKCQLLKLHKKSTGIKASYASNTSVKMILDAFSYYIYKSNALISVKKDRKSILTALVDKQAEIENYIKNKNLKFKDENDLSRLIVYYNSIL